MAKNSPRQVRILNDITYEPLGTLAWYRVFRKDWEGPVTEQQFKFLIGNRAAEALNAPRADTGTGDDGDAQ